LLEETAAAHLRIEIGEMPVVHAIPYQINQLFTNLLSNAVKFSRRNDNPVIRVDATRRNGYHIICVRDNGIGFPREHKDQIFEVFRRLHDRSEYEGTGIGLAICKKIVENHHGRITAESKPGEGATFTIFLPA
jgi:signal transduction histidine kinase